MGCSQELGPTKQVDGADFFCIFQSSLDVTGLAAAARRKVLAGGTLSTLGIGAAFVTFADLSQVPVLACSAAVFGYRSYHFFYVCLRQLPVLISSHVNRLFLAGAGHDEQPGLGEGAEPDASREHRGSAPGTDDDYV